MARFIDVSERGQLFHALAQWNGVAGLDRLTLMQILGANRLFLDGKRLLADLPVDEMARLLGRSTSTVRASLSKLRDDGLIARESAGRTILDLSGMVRAVIGADAAVAFIDASRAPLAPVDQPDILPAMATAECTDQGHGVAELLSQLRAPEPDFLESDADNPEATLQKFGGSLPYSLSKDLYKISTDSDSLSAAHFSEPEFRCLLDRLLSDECDHLPNAEKIKQFLKHVSISVDGNWSDFQLIRSATEQAIRKTLTACADGPALSPSLVSLGGERYGAGLLLHVVYAIMSGDKPKGLLISMLRKDEARVSYSMFSIRSRLNEAAAARSKIIARDQHAAARALEDRAKERASELVQTLCNVIADAPALVESDREDVRSAARTGLTNGQAKIDVYAGMERLCVALPRKADAVLWQYIVDRVSDDLCGRGVPPVSILTGGLVGSDYIRIAEARVH